MSQLLQMEITNWPAFAKGLVDADKLQLRYMRTELKRGAQRIRKTFIREQLKGPPGIKAGALAKGKNIWTYVRGETTKDVHAKIGISRILHVHEKGITITPKSGELLYIRENKSRGGGGTIVAAVKRITIPKRLHFRTLVAREAPKELKKVGEAGARGVEVALTNALKRSL